MNHALRRERVLERLGDGVLVLTAAPERQRSNDTLYRYRPSSDVLWLTGFEEPDCVVVLAPNHPEHRFVMFVRPRNPKMEIWDGHRAGPEGAVERYGADAAYSIDELDERLGDYLAGAGSLWYPLGVDRAFDDRMLARIAALGPGRSQPDRAPRTIHDPRPVIHELRRIKDADELVTLRAAGALSAKAHLAAMKATRPGLHEYEIQAVVEGAFMRGGARAPAYASIVAGGANACVLHYIENRDPLHDGDLLLVDAGAELDWYAGDITRTWPVGAAFSAPQRDVYAAVLEAQIAIVDACRVGASKQSLQEETVRRLTASMVDLGLLKGDLDALIEDEAYRRYYMHNIGHYLGLDVHDVGAYYNAPNEPVPFEPGVVLTVEPGIYVPADDEDAPEALRGIGIRIEDDIVVTSGDPEVLTDGVPKTIDAIESLRAEALDGGHG